MMPAAHDDPSSRPPLTPEQRRERRRLIVAGVIVLGTVALFYLYAIVVFIFRWKIFADPWRVL